MPAQSRACRKVKVAFALALTPVFPPYSWAGPTWAAESRSLGHTPATDIATSARIIEFNTRLMVAGLRCGVAWRDTSAFALYTAFAARNAAFLGKAQRVMTRHLGGLSAFAEEQRAFSDREARSMQGKGASSYCAEMRQVFYGAMSAAQPDLERLANKR
jgi:hypothetical protein